MVMGMVLSLALIVVLIAAISVGCGGGSGDETSAGTSADGQGENTAPTTAPSDGDGTTGGSMDGSTTGEETASEQSGEPAEKPYAAIQPSEDAQPLAENVENDYAEFVLRAEIGEVGERNAAGEQYGEETTEDLSELRSVPLGQTLLADAEDDSDGPLKENRIVAYYGTPLSNLMGILGESEPEVVMEQLMEQTQAYSNADPERPAIPAIEFIASIAQRDPGLDGLYIGRADPEVIEEYARLAKENDALLILDVQLGRATVMEEVRALEDFLKRPHVHLAIDTEYSIDEGEVPGVDLGSVDGAEIQEAVEYLDEMVERENIPDKMVMVHQFDQGIVTNKPLIEPTANVQVALHADGFGTPEAKFSKYGLLVRKEPVQYGGFKVFYNQDTPVLEPDQVLALDPAPAIVTYQ